MLKIGLFLVLIASMLFTACSDSTATAKSQRDIKGQLIDSKVIGVEYHCGSVVDFTDENGTFSCESLPVSFYIGKMALGEVLTLPSDGKVFPQDIVGVGRFDVNNSEVLKLALLLQSLDRDGNASNGIEIEKSRRDKFDDELVVSELTLDELKRVMRDKDVEISFKDKDEVLSHLSMSVGILDTNSLTIDSNLSADNNSSTDNNLTADNNSSTDNNLTADSNSSTDNNLTTDSNSSTDNNLTTDSNLNIDNNLTTDTNLTINSNSTSDNNLTTDSNLSIDNTRDIKGQLIDSKVIGVEYHCGSVVDFTDENGTFSCESLPVSFYIGKMALGEVLTLPSDGKVFPQDIVDVNRSDVNNIEVIKLALLLQSLDSDKNATNGIRIKEQQRDRFDEEIVVSELTLDELKKILKDKDENIIFKNENEVISHLSFSAGILDINNSNRENSSDRNDSVVLLTPTGNPTLVPEEESTQETSTDTSTEQESPATTSVEQPEQEFQTTTPTQQPTPNPVVRPAPVLDTTPPATNFTINAITTANTSPALSGNLPSGDYDSDTSNYTILLEINGTTYSANNNGDGTWSLAQGTIKELEEGIYSVKIIVTDEAGNSSSKVVPEAIEINNTGFLIDSAVEGIKYISGRYSGYTDINGLFKYDYGQGVTFYIGDEANGIPMGTAQVKQDPYNSKRKIISLFDLSGTTDENSPSVVNIGRFLQTLDADGDVSNGITIDKATKDSIQLLGLKDLDFSVDSETFEKNEKLKELFEDLSTHFGGHVRLLSAEEAKAHLVAVRDNKEATKVLTEVTKVRGEKEPIKVLTGVFKTTTGVVEGLDYRCGNQSGRTNEKGEFKYEDGKKVKFSIAELDFGTTDADAVITPANLVPATSFDHPRPRNIVRLLSVFDSDGDNANGITIDKAVREALEKYRFQIDLNLQDGKANPELNIPAGVDEFGAQFEEFEMGAEILNEITKLRAGV